MQRSSRLQGKGNTFISPLFLRPRVLFHWLPALQSSALPTELILPRLKDEEDNVDNLTLRYHDHYGVCVRTTSVCCLWPKLYSSAFFFTRNKLFFSTSETIVRFFVEFLILSLLSFGIVSLILLSMLLLLNSLKVFYLLTITPCQVTIDHHSYSCSTFLLRTPFPPSYIHPLSSDFSIFVL